jgi:hypothetical protein
MKVLFGFIFHEDFALSSLLLLREVPNSLLRSLAEKLANRGSQESQFHNTITRI